MRITQSDGLGRLGSVCEVTSATQMGSDNTPSACGQDIAGTGFFTSYQYDTLDNLLDVHQSNQQQDRQFKYDSLSRLLTASNPESGTTFYAYDSNGNLTGRTRPAPNQSNPAVTVSTNYSYDSLNRVIRKAYSDGVTPEVDFVYDQSSPSIGGVQSLANVNGRLAYAFSPNSTMDIYSYDPVGRTTDMWQCVTTPCTSAWHASHQYDLGGDLLSVGYNGGATLSYQYDSTQRITNVTGSGLWSPPAALFSPTQGQPQYGPVGLLNTTLGTGTGALAEARTYNNRTFLNCLIVGTPGTGCSASMYSVAIGYAGDGDVTSANDSVNGNWTYGYDAFNRLATAQTPPSNPTLAYSYSYDRFGNRWSQAVTAGSGYQMALTFNASNQISTSGYRYDAAGNVLMDGINCYTYDAENRLVSTVPETAPGSGVCGAAANGMDYLYDPDGRRVARLQNGSVVKQYYYDAAGHMIVEANASGSWLRAEIYAGNRHLATWNSNTTYFNHADWLGTERARSDSSGSRCVTITSLPYGDGEATAGSCSNPEPSPSHFTGKERDAESGLDYFGARYNSSNVGRFTSPDPLYLELGRLVDPQRLNLYSYGRNNPLTYYDPTGLDVTCAGPRCADYLKALQKDVSFKIAYDKAGKVVTEGSIDKKGLSKADKALLKAIDDSKHHVTINAVGGEKDASVFFGASHGSTHTINFDQTALLDAPSNSGGATSAGLVGHETLEGYYESKGESLDAAHNETNALFPGLDPGKITSVYGNAATNMAYGFVQQFQVHGTSTTENISINFVTPIPAASLHSNMNAAGYPVKVEKAK